MTILTQWGIGHVCGNAFLADGTPGYLVLLRQKECTSWPWTGAFVFKVIAKDVPHA